MTDSVRVSSDGFIFSGNWQQTVSKALFLDQRLTPLERNAWQIIRMMLEPDGITALPAYEQLRPYLTSMPYAGRASFETVARALTILRLTRWLSLSRRRRAKEGFKQSNLYILHDEPLTPFEAIRLDDDYFALVCQSMTHASKAIQRVAAGVLNDITSDPFLSGKRLPTRLEVLLGRMENMPTSGVIQAELSTGQKSEESESDLLRNQEALNSESEVSTKPAKNHSIRSPNKALVSSSNLNILLQTMEQRLDIPKRFYQLSTKQQQGVLKTICNLEPDIQQQIFNEWEERCQRHQVRKPAAYLFGIAQKAYRGELNDLAEIPMQQSQAEEVSQAPKTLVIPDSTASSSEYIPPSPEQKEAILKHLQELKEKFLRK